MFFILEAITLFIKNIMLKNIIFFSLKDRLVFYFCRNFMNLFLNRNDKFCETV